MKQFRGPGRRCPASAILLLLTLLSGSPGAWAQSFGFSKELRFAQYLQDKNALQEAMQVLSQIDTSGLRNDQKDSLSYMLGWDAYNAKLLDQSVADFLRVSADFPGYRKARFFAAWCEAFQGRTDSASGLLKQLSLPDTIQQELRALQLAGIALLKRDDPAYRKWRAPFTYDSYIFGQEEKRLDQYSAAMSGYPRKSAWLAGFYSALIPGLGKIYAGRAKQGIAAFLPVMSLALLTYESYRKDGVKSASFIGFGSLFSLFYIGNIWGSTLSVKIKRNEFYKEYDTKILFDMHIPLRNFFN